RPLLKTSSATPQSSSARSRGRAVDKHARGACHTFRGASNDAPGWFIRTPTRPGGSIEVLEPELAIRVPRAFLPRPVPERLVEVDDSGMLSGVLDVVRSIGEPCVRLDRAHVSALEVPPRMQWCPAPGRDGIQR